MSAPNYAAPWTRPVLDHLRETSSTPPAPFFGWAMAMNRWSDETGTFHLITRRGRSVTACGRTSIRHGGVEYKPEQIPDRGHACARCRRAVTAR